MEKGLHPRNLTWTLKNHGFPVRNLFFRGCPHFQVPVVRVRGPPILINIWLGESSTLPFYPFWLWDSPKNFQENQTQKSLGEGYHLISPSNRAWSMMFRVKIRCKTIKKTRWNQETTKKKQENHQFAWELQQIWMDFLSDLSEKYLGLPVDFFRHLPSNQVNPFHLLLRQLCQVRQG